MISLKKILLNSANVALLLSTISVSDDAKIGKWTKVDLPEIETRTSSSIRTETVWNYKQNIRKTELV